MLMKNKFILLILLGLSFLLNGCMSVIVLQNYSPTPNDYSLIYKGAREGLTIGFSPTPSYHYYGPPTFFYLFDVPFSFILDTILLPYSGTKTLYYRYKFNKNQDLFKLIRNNDLKKLQALLPSKRDINSKDYEGNTLLMEASKIGAVDIIKFLLEKGVDISTPDANGKTAFSLTLSDTSNYEAYKTFLSFDEKLISYNDYAFLFEAIGLRKIEVVKDLLTRIPNIEKIKNQTGQSVLLYAVQANTDGEIVHLLLEKKFNLSDRDDDGFGLLHYAVQNSDLAMVSYFAKNKVDINSVTKSKETPLSLALQNEDEEKRKIAAFLLDNTANINYKNADGQSLLHLSAQFGYLDIVKKIIQKKADVNAKAANGSTPLMLALYAQKSNVVDYLKDLSDLNVIDEKDSGLIHYGAEYGTAKFIQFLISKKVDINARTKWGQTAIFLALNSYTEYGPEIVKLLIQNKADATYKDDSGWEMIHHAAHHGNADLLRYLISQGIDLHKKEPENETPIILAFKQKHWKAVTVLAQNGGDINSIDKEGKNALWYAVEDNNPEAVKELVDLKIDVHSSKSKDAYSLAKKYKYSDLYKYFQ
ncbi:MAG: ankyrin repeat domain-containing protein [Leptospiraceae bacterium]|nr:ankyrin repeat domain-containing protein [Leptospiraceae bacterium]